MHTRFVEVGAGNCFSPCGSTICDVNCKWDKDTKSYSGCTVTIYGTVPRGRHLTPAGTTEHRNHERGFCESLTERLISDVRRVFALSATTQRTMGESEWPPGGLPRDQAAVGLRCWLARSSWLGSSLPRADHAVRRTPPGTADPPLQLSTSFQNRLRSRGIEQQQRATNRLHVALRHNDAPD